MPASGTDSTLCRYGHSGKRSKLAEPAVGPRRPVDAAAQTLQAVAVVGSRSGGRVQGEAAGDEAQRRGALTGGRVSEDPPQALAGAGPQRLGALDGCGGQAGEDGRVLGQDVFAGVVEHVPGGVAKASFRGNRPT